MIIECYSDSVIQARIYFSQISMSYRAQIILFSLMLMLCSSQSLAQSNEHEVYKSRLGTTKLLSKRKTEKRYTLFAPKIEADHKAYIIDQFGKIIKSWSSKPSSKGAIPEEDAWYLINLYQNNLYALKVNSGLEVLNPTSKVIRTHRGMYHHDFFFNEGSIYVLKRGPIEEKIYNHKTYLVNDYIVRINPETSNEEMVFSMKDHFLDQVSYEDKQDAIKFTKLLDQEHEDPLPMVLQNTPADVFHTNSLKRIEYDVQDIAKKNDLLINIPKIRKTVIYRPSEKKIVKEFGPLRLKSISHDPTLLPNGKLLYFINNYMKKDIQSKVVIYNPKNKKIAWEFPKSDQKRVFFSKSRGRVQVLEDNHYLITSSNEGAAFEVNHAGQIIWSFEYNNKDNKSEGIGYFIRLNEQEVQHFL